MAIRVRPGAATTGVGGGVGDRLVVRVHEKAIDGKATNAALKAVANAFGVRISAVTLVAGATSRDKVVDVAGDTSALQQRLEELRAS